MWPCLLCSPKFKLTPQLYNFFIGVSLPFLPTDAIYYMAPFWVKISPPNKIPFGVHLLGLPGSLNWGSSFEPYHNK